MKSIYRLTCIVILSFLLENLVAQSQPAGKVISRKSDEQYLKNMAEQNYASMNYAYAIPFYEKYLSDTSRGIDTLCLLHLSESYRLIRNYEGAIKGYSRLSVIAPQYKNRLAELYANISDYQDAIKVYKEYIALPGADRHMLAAERLKGFSDTKYLLRDSLDWNLYYSYVNTIHQESTPVPYGAGWVYTSTQRTKFLKKFILGWNGENKYKLLFVADSLLSQQRTLVGMGGNNVLLLRKVAGIDLTPQTSNDNSTLSYPLVRIRGSRIGREDEFNPFFSKQNNVSSICFTSDQQTAYYTVNHPSRRGISRLEIKAARKEHGKWHELQSPVAYSVAYSSFQPAINATGKRLYFVSDRPGGIGGTDIYFIEKVNDSTWGEVKNAGELVNTEGNELFPVLKGDLLYFSSDGKEGLGGYDIYRIDLAQNHTTAENMGYPINSSFDDFGLYAVSDSMGYFSSNRMGTDDIFRYSYAEKKYLLAGRVKFLSDSTVADSSVLLLVDKDYPGHADTVYTDADGHYSVHVKPNRTYELQQVNPVLPSQKGESSNVTLTTVSTEMLQQNIQKDLGISGRSKKQVLDAIRKQREAEALLLQRHIEDSIRSQQSNRYIVYFDLNKAVLTKADKVVLDSMVNVLQAHSTLNVVVGSFTDCSGSIRYNMKLSAKRSAASVRYILSRGIAKSRITESHYGKQYLVAHCMSKYNVRQQMLNRRSELILTERSNKKWDELHADTTIGKSVYSAIIAGAVASVSKESVLKKTEGKTAVQQKAVVVKATGKTVIKKEQAPLKTGDQLQSVKDSVIRVVAEDARTKSVQENVQSKQELISVLDSLARLKSEQERIVTYLTKRINKTPIPIYTAADSVTIEIYDSGIHDNDSISVIYNKRLVVDRKELMVNKPIKFVVKVDKNSKNNELVVVAENLGTEPPNTAVLVITDKYNKRQEVMLSTDLTHNEVVYFIKIMKDKK